MLHGLPWFGHHFINSLHFQSSEVNTSHYLAKASPSTHKRKVSVRSRETQYLQKYRKYLGAGEPNGEMPKPAQYGLSCSSMECWLTSLDFFCGKTVGRGMDWSILGKSTGDWAGACHTGTFCYKSSLFKFQHQLEMLFSILTGRRSVPHRGDWSETAVLSSVHTCECAHTCIGHRSPTLSAPVAAISSFPHPLRRTVHLIRLCSLWLLMSEGISAWVCG